MKHFSRGKYSLNIIIPFLLSAIFTVSASFSSEGTPIGTILNLDSTLEFHLVASAGYITDKNPQLATIISAEQDKISIEKNDLVYIDRGARDDVELGGVYAVYRLENEVMNPGTSTILGRILKIMGFLKIVSLEENLAMGVITNFYDIIYIGDRIGLVRNVLPSWHYSLIAIPEDRRVRGLIIGSKESRIVLGEYDIVYINLGRDHGIGPGFHFRILRPLGVRSSGDLEARMEQEIGELEIISSQKSTATAIVKISRQEIFPNEFIEMKPPAKLSRAMFK